MQFLFNADVSNTQKTPSIFGLNKPALKRTSAVNYSNEDTTSNTQQTIDTNDSNQTILKQNIDEITTNLKEQQLDNEKDILEWDATHFDFAYIIIAGYLLSFPKYAETVLNLPPNKDSDWKFNEQLSDATKKYLANYRDFEELINKLLTISSKDDPDQYGDHGADIKMLTLVVANTAQAIQDQIIEHDMPIKFDVEAAKKQIESAVNGIIGVCRFRLKADFFEQTTYGYQNLEIIGIDSDYKGQIISFETGSTNPVRVLIDKFGFLVLEYKLYFRGSRTGTRKDETCVTIRYTNITSWDKSKGTPPSPDQLRNSHLDPNNFTKINCKGVEVPSFKKDGFSNKSLEALLGASLDEWKFECAQFDGKLTFNKKGYLFDGVGIAIATTRGGYDGPEKPSGLEKFYEEVPIEIENYEDSCNKPINFYRKKALKFTIMNEIIIDGKTIICTAVNQDDHVGSLSS